MNASGDNKGKKDNKKKEQAPKKEQPKKAEKKEEAPAAEAEPKPVKEKDPFAAMPAGSFVMDEWKKMFSNNPEVRPIFHRNLSFHIPNLMSTDHRVFQIDGRRVGEEQRELV